MSNNYIGDKPLRKFPMPPEWKKEMEKEKQKDKDSQSKSSTHQGRKA